MKLCAESSRKTFEDDREDVFTDIFSMTETINRVFNVEAHHLPLENICQVVYCSKSGLET